MRTKSVLLGTTTAALSLLLVAPAHATHFNGWYVGLEGGASWVDDFDHTLLTTFNAFTPTFTFNGGTSNTFLGRSDFDTGWAVFATVGYGFGGGFRAELELGYRDNDGDGFLSFATPVPLLTPFTGFAFVTAPYTVELTQFTVMANLIYDIRFSDRFSMSVGAGVGADHMDYDVAFLGLSADDSEWKFAWQALAGLNVRIAPQTQLFLNYRYLQAEDIDDRFFANTAVFGASFQDALLISDDEVTKHAATIGIRFDLAPDYVAPPPAPPPPPPPPPEPPPAPKEFIVFFGHDKANLTAEAMGVVREAAMAFKATGAANIRVVGHTDRSGSDAYNQELAMRRANTVRGALAGEGVPDGAISVDGRGESDPMVPTDDGVREPQNRRVNISI